MWHDDGSMFVKDPNVVSIFGWIPAVVDWPNVNDANTLYSKAVKYLKDEQYEKMVLEIQVLDLKYLQQGDASIKFLSKLRCISEPHGMDHTFIVSKMDLDLTNPGNSLYTLGTDVKLSLTQTASKVNQEILDQIERIPSKSEILKAAQRNAYTMIMGDDGSYVHLIPGDDGGIKRIEITDGPLYDREADMDPDPTTDPFPNSLNRWVWTVRGLGHVGRSTYQEVWDDIGEMNLALTYDGHIVADYITAGTMSCDRLNGGVINGQTINGGTITGTEITANAGHVTVLGSGYMKYHQSYPDSDHLQWTFDLGCRYCNCMYDDGVWHWVNGGATEIYKYLEGAYQASDRRVKDNIESISSDLAKALIMGVDPVKFNYTYDESKENFGMIAQDVWDVCEKLGIQKKNGLVHVFDNPDEMWDIEYKQFVPFLIKMVQDQQKEIEKLKEKSYG